MRCIFTICILFLVDVTCCGRGKATVVLNEKVIGKNLLTDEDIKAKEYAFSDRIFDLYVDSLSKRFTVQLGGASSNGRWMDNRGDVIMYDASEQKVLWSKNISYGVRNFDQYGDFLIQTTSFGKSFSVDVETGEKLWDLRNTVLFADKNRRIGIGYKSIGVASAHVEILEGIDLATGKLKWTRTIPFDWDQISPLNDSVLLIVSQGIHAVNLNTGKGWDYRIKTWYEDNNGWITAENVLSNILTDSGRIYMAGIGKLACLDEAGKEIWVHNYTNNYVSKSILCHNDSVVYLVNKGTAVKDRREIYHGRPFIAAYDKRTGKELFFRDFPVKKNSIKDFDLDKDNIYLLFNDRVVRYTVANNNITQKIFNTDSIGMLKLFIGGRAYLPANTPEAGSYQSLRFSDMNRQYFLTENDKVFILDSMNVIAHAELKNFYYLYHTSQRHQFIQKDGETILLDNYGRSLAKLKMSDRSFLRGKTLYDVQDNRIIEVNLEELLID